LSINSRTLVPETRRNIDHFTRRAARFQSLAELIGRLFDLAKRLEAFDTALLD
jgi:hypothetical protein